MKSVPPLRQRGLCVLECGGKRYSARRRFVSCRPKSVPPFGCHRTPNTTASPNTPTYESCCYAPNLQRASQWGVFRIACLQCLRPLPICDIYAIYAPAQRKICLICEICGHLHLHLHLLLSPRHRPPLRHDRLQRLPLDPRLRIRL